MSVVEEGRVGANCLLLRAVESLSCFPRIALNHAIATLTLSSSIVLSFVLLFDL